MDSPEFTRVPEVCHASLHIAPECVDHWAACTDHLLTYILTHGLGLVTIVCQCQVWSAMCLTYILEVTLHFLVVVKNFQKRLVDVRTVLIAALHKHTSVLGPTACETLNVRPSVLLLVTHNRQ